MSQKDTKLITVNVKDLSFRREQMVVDLIRFLAEQLPQIQITRKANDIEILMPIKLSKRAIKLRIKKFLYRKDLSEDFRPISLKTHDIDGYVVKEKKILPMTYY